MTASARTTTWKPRRPLVVVTAPGPGSGKMATCPLRSSTTSTSAASRPATPNTRRSPFGTCRSSIPVNIAYEAATVDLDDANIIDPFHLEAYGETTVNYNRDVETFPVLKSHDGAHLGRKPLPVAHRYGREHGRPRHCATTTPCRDAAKMEIVRRYFTAAVDLQPHRHAATTRWSGSSCS